MLAVGCGKQQPSPNVIAQVPSGVPAQVQPKLPTIKLFVGTMAMDAEQALTEKQIQTGMMFRKTMGPNEGMLFVFQRPKQQGFWMKNCFVPLSAAYIDTQGRIAEVVHLEPHNTNSVWSRSFQIQYVLEVPRGWFKKNGLGPGVMIMTEKGTLPQTYFPRR